MPIYLYITPFFPSKSAWKGGYFLDAAKAIGRVGNYDVRVVVANGACDYEWDGLRVYGCKRISLPCGLAPFLTGWINRWLFKRMLKRVRISPLHVAVCHANMMTCVLYAEAVKRWNPNAKSIAQFHSCYAFDLRSGRLGVLPIHAMLVYFHYRALIERLDALIFISKVSQDTFGKCFMNVPEGEVRDVRSLFRAGRFMRDLKLPQCKVVYNGIDRSLFASARIAHEGFVVGCVANFQPLKGQMTLLEAVVRLKDRIPNLKVRLVGSDVASRWTGRSSDGTLKACKEYVGRNGLSDVVYFEKEVDHRELPDFYQSIDLFVLPSRLEGFGCVYAESWACGTPFICCKGTGIAEVVPHEETKRWVMAPQASDELSEMIYAYYKSRWTQNLRTRLDIDLVWQSFFSSFNT